MSVLEHTRILVTGGGGFIGTHLVRALVQEGSRVRIMSRGPRIAGGLRDIARSVEFYPSSITSRRGVRRCIREFQPKIVFHLAGRLPNTSDRKKFEQVNIGGTKLLAAELAGSPVCRFITLGSSSEYGKSRSPVSERSRSKPSTPYGISKRQATDFLRTFSRSAPFPVVVLRPSTVFGPGQASGMFIPDCIRATLVGEVFPMGDPNTRRDFLYVSDLVEALLKAATAEVDRFTLCNVGSGHGMRLSYVSALVARAAGKEARTVYNPLRSSGDQWLAVDRARDVLGWRARTSFTDAIEKTVSWYSTHISFFDHA